MANRRDFLRLLGAGLGGTLLSSCGSSSGTAKVGPGGGSGTTPLPNALHFTPVLDVANGRVTRGGRNLDLSDLTPGAVMMNDQNQIIFYGTGSGGNLGIHQLTMDYGRGRAPSVADSQTLLRQGDTVAGRSVDLIYPGDTNSSGSFGVIIGSDGQTPALIMRNGPTGAFERILEAMMDLPGGQGFFGGSIDTFSLGANDDILLVARYSQTDQPASAQGAFLMPGASVDNSQILTSSGQPAPQSDGVIDSIGLVDLGEGGAYVLMVNTSPANPARRPARAPGESRCNTAVIYGHVRQAFSRSRLLTASPVLGASRAASTGESYLAARVGKDDSAMRVVHVTEEHLVMYFRDQVIAETGGLSPSGHVIRSITPGVVNGPAGLCYYQLFTDEGLELCVSNGVEHRTLLSRGDKIDGKVVNTFIFGFHPEQVDSQGRCVIQVEFTDGTMSIVVAFPA
ncbi:MAG: hypothetical protein GX785_02960 [Armatimonadetes bacterium]|nr:hypothetical protein [Armatimonadota bacterium]HOQ27191.1 hypothetical protein [Armatimonadota bacterium]